MTHVTCRLTAKNRDQLRDPIRSAVEYGLPLPLPLPLYRVFFIYFHVGCCRRRLRSQAKVIKRCGQNGHEAIDNATNSGYCEIGYDASMKAAHRRAPTVDYAIRSFVANWPAPASTSIKELLISLLERVDAARNV